MTTVEPVVAPVVVERLPRSPEAYVFQGPERGFERVVVPGLALAAGEMLVEIELATICGSDRHTVAGTRHEDVPLVLGHEQLGRVVAFGPGAAPKTVDGHELRLGDRIVWSIAVRCGNCVKCRGGLSNKCERLRKYGHSRIRRGWELNGSFATHMHIMAGSDIVRVPEDVPAEVFAPASCATATVAAALAAAGRPLAGELVVVSGCGMLGLTAIAMARSRGATVVGIDPDKARRQQARAFGAELTCKPGAEALRSVLREAMHDLPMTTAWPGFGVAFEMSGANKAIESLLDVAGTGASVVLVGSVFPAKPIEVSAEQLVRKLVTITGVHNYVPEHLVEAVEFLRGADHEQFAALVGATIGFDDLPAAFAYDHEAAVRVGVRP